MVTIVECALRTFCTVARISAVFAKAHISISTCVSVTQPGLLVLARCNSIFSRKLAPTKQHSLSLAEIKSLQRVGAIGVTDHFAVLDNGTGGVQFGVTFPPGRVGNLSLICPRSGAEFLYFFEIDVCYSRDKMTFKWFGHTESTSYQIGNTRALLRQRNKMVGEFQSMGGPPTHAG
ncbi:unnamed protein product [Peronospora destructor]|uniref:Uncharacterized protein n=1 Tax=Peronospora destructor TaxID=86335 RepID=A0AAV0URT8_9STRA|nr:unnamed protein product [Peronospora destructor]